MCSLVRGKLSLCIYSLIVLFSFFCLNCNNCQPLRSVISTLVHFFNLFVWKTNISGSFLTTMVGTHLEAKKPTRCLLDRARSLALEIEGSNGKYIPKCTDYGRYDPVQCHPALGQCWCVDKYGNELDETRQEGNPYCNDTGEYCKSLKTFVQHKSHQRVNWARVYWELPENGIILKNVRANTIPTQVRAFEICAICRIWLLLGIGIPQFFCYFIILTDNWYKR